VTRWLTSKAGVWGRGLVGVLAILVGLGGVVAWYGGLETFSGSPVVDASRGEVAATDPSLFYSPWNWGSDDSVLQTTHLGAWLKFGWTGRSLRLRVDVSRGDRAGLPPESYPVVGYSIDGGPFQVLRLVRGDRERTLADGLSEGRHTCRAYLRWVGFGHERWRAGRQVALWQVTGLRLDPGASVFRDPELRPRRVLFFGDSILDGAFNLGAETDSRRAWPEVVAERLDAEPGRVGFEGQSYAIVGNASNGNVPALFIPGNPRESTWDLLDSAHPRLAAGRFAPLPDVVFLSHGANDAINRVFASQVEEALGGLLPRLRAAAGPACLIVVVVPFEGFFRKTITAVVAAYRSSTRDARCHLVDLGPDASSRGVDQVAGQAIPRSFDGLHPNVAMHARLGAKLADSVIEIDPSLGLPSTVGKK